MVCDWAWIIKLGRIVCIPKLLTLLHLVLQLEKRKVSILSDEMKQGLVSFPFN